MITVVASYNVTPNQPTPKNPLWLSVSDQIMFLGHVSTIYVYKIKPYDTHIEELRNSLSKILVYYYPVTGRLSLTENGLMEIDCNAKGVTLLEAETTNTFGDYGDFSPSESTKELVPKVDYTQPIEELPLLVVQLTRFHGGEGFAIGVAKSHVLFDGVSAAQFMHMWAKLARGEALEPNELPYLDRTILKFPHQQPSAAASCVDLSAESKLRPVQVLDNFDSGFDSHVATELLKLTSSQVEKLKNKANDHQPSKESGVRPYSRFEAIGAHIWRCASKSRECGENQTTVTRFVVDIRGRLLNPPLPRNYVGNALVKTVSPECYIGDIISNPLCYAAQKIRDAVNVVTDEYIRSQLNVIVGQEQLDSIRAFFSGKGIQMSSPHPGNHSIVIAGWTNMPVYEIDFGWGKPVHFGLGSDFREERAVIMPSSDGNGVVVTTNFQTIDMQLFKKFFYQDV